MQNFQPRDVEAFIQSLIESNDERALLGLLTSDVALTVKAHEGMLISCLSIEKGGRVLVNKPALLSALLKSFDLTNLNVLGFLHKVGLFVFWGPRAEDKPPCTNNLKRFCHMRF
jgi:hypothetical protein